RISQYRSRVAAPYVCARCSFRWACTRSLSMSVLSTSNRKTILGVPVIACHAIFSVCWVPCSKIGERQDDPSARLGLVALAEELLRDLGHPFRLEPEFSLQLLERGRRAECLHADD